MSVIDLKKKFHQLIDTIENEALLLDFYSMMKSRTISENGQLWNALSKSEQEELLKIFDETENPNTLISHQVMKQKHQKWL